MFVAPRISIRDVGLGGAVAPPMRSVEVESVVAPAGITPRAADGGVAKFEDAGADG